MNAAVKAALMSTGKKVLRTLGAVAAAALIAALPAAQEVFQNAAEHGSIVEKAVFGLVVSGLVGLAAFAERYTSVNKNGK